MKVSCVLFDLDGVLVDACDWHYEALNAALMKHGYAPINRQDHLQKYNGLPTKVKLQMLGIADDIATRINDEKQRYTLDIIRNSATIMREKIELHEYLKSAGVRIACVTNSIEETAREMLVSTGQMPYIDLLVSNELVNRNKPHPDCYNYAIRTLNVEPSQCVCVEDSPKGIQAATASIAGHLWVVDNSSQVTLEQYLKFVEEDHL